MGEICNPTSNGLIRPTEKYTADRLAVAEERKRAREESQAGALGLSQEQLAAEAEADAQAASRVIQEMEADLGSLPTFIRIRRDTGEMISPVLPCLKKSRLTSEKIRTWRGCAAISAKRNEYNEANRRAKELRSQASASRSRSSGSNGRTQSTKAMRDPQGNVVTLSEKEIRDMGGNDSDIEDARRRVQRGEIRLVP